MTRLTALVGLGALLLLAASCGPSSPSVSVKIVSYAGPPVPVITFSGPGTSSRSEVWVFDVLPSGGPSGVLALKSVHDGRVKTWGTLRFHDLKRTGTAAVLVTGNSIETFFSAGGSLADLASVVAEKTVGETAFTSTTLHSPVEAGHEEDFWLQNRFPGQQSSSETLASGVDLSVVVSNSLQTPTMTSYCITVSVDKAAS
jgi:hypothetical protein